MNKSCVLTALLAIYFVGCTATAITLNVFTNPHPTLSPGTIGLRGEKP
jgi:hypothetical protein